MINIIIQRLKDQYRGIIYYLMGLVSYVWMLMAMFPTIEQANFEEIMKNYPEDLLKFFGGSESAVSFSTIEGFLSMEFLSLFFILIILFYIGASAGSAIAGSIEKHQMDFTLSQPVSRTRLVLGETIVGIAYTTMLVMVTVISIWLLAQAYNVDMDNKGLLALCFVASVFLLSIYGIAIFLSSFMRSKMAVTGAVAGITIGFYLLTSLGNIVEKLEPYKSWSLFYLYAPQQLLTNAAINWTHVYILLSIFLLGLLGSLLIFNRRDI